MAIRDPLSYPYPPGLYCSVDDGAGAGGGGGTQPPAPDPVPPAPPAPAPPPAPAGGDDEVAVTLAEYGERLKAYDAKLGELKGVVAEQSTALERANTEVARLKGDVRSRELARSHVRPECAQYIPADIDLSTDDGKTKLEEIRSAHPYFFEAESTEAPRVKPLRERGENEPRGLFDVDPNEYEAKARLMAERFRGMVI